MNRFKLLPHLTIVLIGLVCVGCSKPKPNVWYCLAYNTPNNVQYKIDETGDRGWTNYLALIAYINNSPYWGQKMMSKLFDKLVLEFIAALRKALPGAADEDLYWCYHNLSGALTLTLAQTGRIDKLSGGKCRSSDFQAAYDHMIPFTAAGFRQVCGKKQ